MYNNSTLIISDDNNNRTQNDCAALCLNPDYLLPTTKIVSSSNCLRRVVLEQFWVTDGGYREDNEITVIDSNQTYNSQCDVMLTGSLVHELFQKVNVSLFYYKKFMNEKMCLIEERLYIFNQFFLTIKISEFEYCYIISFK